MNKFRAKSIQTRLAALIGALVMTAAVTAMLAIVNAAAYQQQLALVQDYASALQENAQARAALLKTQTAVKNTFITNEYRAQDYGRYARFSRQFDEYLYMQALRDEPVEELVQQNDQYSTKNEAFFEAINSENPNWVDLARVNLEEIDPMVDTMEAQVQALYDSNLLALRQEITDIEDSTRENIVIGQWALLALAGLLIWSVYEMMSITTPLGNLTGAIVAFENNTYKPGQLAQDGQRPDEMGELARAVDGMAKSISESNRLKEQFLQSAQRFIPTQYLEFLEKDSITNVHLGDHVSAEMAVMFSDIRGFTGRSETMTAGENFDFVNEYLKLVSPIIQKHEGFIVKFLGDGMMAIFPYGVADAVQAGIEKSQMVQTFNETLRARGLPPINVGIGIHTGAMMVGMIGEELRMQGDAFSDNVNLTSRIEGLNKFYGTSMIISEETLSQLPQPVTFKMRYLGKAVVKGRAAPLGMYEVYEGMPAAEAARKEATRPFFERGLGLFISGKFAEAGLLFSAVTEQDPADKTARLYFEICSEMHEKPLPAGWNGAIVMETK